MNDEKKLVLYPSPEIYQKLIRAATQAQTSVKKLVKRFIEEGLRHQLEPIADDDSEDQSEIMIAALFPIENNYITRSVSLLEIV